MDTNILALNDNIDKSSEEAFEMLRMNVLFCSNNRQIKTLTIASPTPGAGKTTVSINLAIALSKINMKVMLVDSDFRTPTVIKKLSGINRYGLAAYFQYKTKLEDIIVKTNIPNLSFASCGPTPPKPSDMILSRDFSEFIKLLKNQYDIVIFDTPFLGNITDAAVIASQTDATILVIQLGNTTSKSLNQAMEQLKKANANIIGAVLNNVNKSYYKEHYQYSGYFDKLSKNLNVL